MINKLEYCKVCDEPFEWNDETIQVVNDYYHKKCVTLYPTGFCAFADDIFLGETENDDGSLAYSLLNEDEYIDLDEQKEEKE